MADFEKMPEHKREGSGDHSGQGRQRRDDGDVFPAKRDRDELGTHGGPKRRSTGAADEREGQR